MARRIILVGKTGNGKSSTGNTLFRKQVFKAGKSLRAVTLDCEMREDNLLKLKVVDSPGLFDTETKLGKRALEIQRSVKLCENPHAFLLIFSASNRMTSEEKFTIDMLRLIFGEKVFDHSIIVFTRGCALDDDKEFETFCADFENLSGLVERCGNRVLRIENGEGCSIHTGNNVVNTIISMVDDVSKHGRFLYSYKYLDIHCEELENHSDEYKGPENAYEELNALSKRLSKRLDRRVWRGKIEGMAIGAAGTGILQFVKNNIQGWISYLFKENASSTVLGIQTTVVTNLGETALESTKEVGKEVVTEAKTGIETVVAELGKAALENTVMAGDEIVAKTGMESAVSQLGQTAVENTVKVGGVIGKAALESTVKAGEEIATKTCIETTVAELGKAALEHTVKVGEDCMMKIGIETAVPEVGKAALENAAQSCEAILTHTGIETTISEIGKAAIDSTVKVGEAIVKATGIDTVVTELGKVALETTEKVGDEIVKTTGIDTGVTELGRATL